MISFDWKRSTINRCSSSGQRRRLVLLLLILPPLFLISQIVVYYLLYASVPMLLLLLLRIYIFIYIHIHIIITFTDSVRRRYGTESTNGSDGVICNEARGIRIKIQSSLDDTISTI